METVFDWDFSKLPSSEYNNVVEALEIHNTAFLLTLHNTYRLSSNAYCCNVHKAMINWFTYGIENNLIVNEE